MGKISTRHALLPLLISSVFWTQPVAAGSIDITGVPQFEELFLGVNPNGVPQQAQFFEVIEPALVPDPANRTPRRGKTDSVRRVLSASAGGNDFGPGGAKNTPAEEVVNLVLFGRDTWLDVGSAVALAGALRGDRPGPPPDLAEHVLETMAAGTGEAVWQVDDAGYLRRSVDGGASILVGTGLVLIYRIGKNNR